MKKIKLMALALVVCSLGLASCGNKDEGSKDNEQQQVADEVVSVTVSGDSQRLNIKSRLQLSANVEVKGNASKNVTWSSSDESVATVDENGLVTPVANGDVVITATSTADTSKKGTFTITVFTDPKVLSVTIQGAETMLPNAELQLAAVVEAEGDASSKVNWTSLTPDVVSVNESGLVTALKVGNASIKATSEFDEDQFDVVSFKVSNPAVLVFSSLMPDKFEPGDEVDFSQYITVTGSSNSFAIAPGTGSSELVSIEGTKVTFTNEGDVSLVFSSFGVSEEKDFTCISFDRFVLSQLFDGEVANYTTYLLDGGYLYEECIHGADYLLVNNFDGTNPGGFLRFEQGRAYEYLVVSQDEEKIVNVGEVIDPYFFSTFNPVFELDFANAEIVHYEETYQGEVFEVDGLEIYGVEAEKIVGATIWGQHGMVELSDGTEVPISRVIFNVSKLSENVYCAVGTLVCYDEDAKEEFSVGSIVIVPEILENENSTKVEDYLNDPENIPEKMDLVSEIGIDSAFLTKDGNNDGSIESSFFWAAIDAQYGQIVGAIEPQDTTGTILDGAYVGDEIKYLGKDLLAIIGEDSAPTTGTLAQHIEGESGSEENVVYYYDGFSKWSTDDFENVWDNTAINLGEIFDPELWTSDYIVSYEEDQENGCYHINFALTQAAGIIETLVKSTMHSDVLVSAADTYEKNYGVSLWEEAWYLDCVFVPKTDESPATLIFTCYIPWDNYDEPEYPGQLMSAYAVQIIVKADPSVKTITDPIVAEIFAEEPSEE